MLPEHLVSVDGWFQLLQFFHDPLVLVPDLQVTVQLRLHVERLSIDDEIGPRCPQVKAPSELVLPPTLYFS